ncbi:hypothetical protein BC829DRAFT_424158 [Chytridium lagenaria]|nr:hypothetical protein BC829DRAFT_424158 [Chytridium lagenaria]
MDIQQSTPSNPTATDTAKDTEEGEILEALSSTKIAAFKADLTQTVVKELLTVMKEIGFTNPSSPHAGSRRQAPKIFSEHFDVNTPRPPSGPLSFAAAARQIARGAATPEHAARMGFAEPGPLRYTIIRNALLAIGIDSGVLDMSFIGKSVVHLLCDSSKAASIQSKLTSKGVFLPEFNPLEVPELVVSSSKSKAEREEKAAKTVLNDLEDCMLEGDNR